MCPYLYLAVQICGDAKESVETSSHKNLWNICKVSDCKKRENVVQLLLRCEGGGSYHTGYLFDYIQMGSFDLMQL